MTKDNILKEVADNLVEDGYVCKDLFYIAVKKAF